MGHRIIAYEDGKNFLKKIKLKYASECGILIKNYKNRQTLGAPPPDPHSLALDLRTSCLFPIMNS